MNTDYNEALRALSTTVRSGRLPSLVNQDRGAPRHVSKWPKAAELRDATGRLGGAPDVLPTWSQGQPLALTAGH
jgi:hypothetical protein